MKLIIKNGTIINPVHHQHEKGDVVIEDGKIVSLGGIADVPGAEVYDAEGFFVTPGLIDMHVHLREPGQEAKEDIHTGTQAAAAGGITHVVTMANTKPVIDNMAVLRAVQKRVEEDGVVKVSIIGSVSKGLKGEQLSEMGDLSAAGAVAFSDDGHYVENANFMRRAMEYAGQLGKMIIDHAEDMTMCGDGFMNEGIISYQMGVAGRPAVGEDIAVSRDLLLSQLTGCHIHIAHVSSAKAVELIRDAKKKGIDCSTEVTAQHLYFTDDYLKNYESAFKMAPPIRTEKDRQALINGLLDGTIDAIMTDHAPHAEEEKDCEFSLAPSGFVGLETSLGLMLTYFYHTGKLDLISLIRTMTVHPAALLRVDAGNAAVGKAADLTLIDLDREWVVDATAFYSQGKSSPFDGMKLRGRAAATIVDGMVVMKDGEVLA